jgi:beta-galactosidase
MGYARSLVRGSINFRIIEEEHLDELANLKILFMPRTIVLPASAEAALEKFVRNGGTLVCESECGAFNPAGIYSYPEDRFISRLTGVTELGRRTLNSNTVTANIDGTSLELPVNQWATPLNAAGCNVLANSPYGPIVVEKNVGKGKVVLCGSYLGNGYMDDRRESFELFVSSLVNRAGCRRDVTVISPQKTRDVFVYIRCGSSNGHPIVFVFFPENICEATIEFRQDFFRDGSVTDIISGKTFNLAKSANGKTCTLKSSEIGIAVLTENNYDIRK